jgi:hypothetical protein
MCNYSLSVCILCTESLYANDEKENKDFDLIWFDLFATGVIDTGGKFAAGVVDTGGNLPPVSTAPVVLVAKFAAGVVDTGGAPCLVNISAHKK